MMHHINKIWLISPPEDPQLFAVFAFRPDITSPYTQQVGLQATDETQKNGVVLGWSRDDWAAVAMTLEIVATPFDTS